MSHQLILEKEKVHIYILLDTVTMCVSKVKLFLLLKKNPANILKLNLVRKNPVLVEIPKNYSSAHINLSNEPSIILSVVNPSWKPDNRDEHNVTYDDYDWNKWKK